MEFPILMMKGKEADDWKLLDEILKSNQKSTVKWKVDKNSKRRPPEYSPPKMAQIQTSKPLNCFTDYNTNLSKTSFSFSFGASNAVPPAFGGSTVKAPVPNPAEKKVKESAKPFNCFTAFNSKLENTRFSFGVHPIPPAFRGSTVKAPVPNPAEKEVKESYKPFNCFNAFNSKLANSKFSFGGSDAVPPAFRGSTVKPPVPNPAEKEVKEVKESAKPIKYFTAFNSKLENSKFSFGGSDAVPPAFRGLTVQPPVPNPSVKEFKEVKEVEEGVAEHAELFVEDRLGPGGADSIMIMTSLFARALLPRSQEVNRGVGTNK